MTTPHDRRQYLARLRDVADWLDHCAVLEDNNPTGGNETRRWAYAVRWAWRELGGENPEVREPQWEIQKFFDTLAGE